MDRWLWSTDCLQQTSHSKHIIHLRRMASLDIYTNGAAEHTTLNKIWSICMLISVRVFCTDPLRPVGTCGSEPHLWTQRREAEEQSKESNADEV